MGLRRGFKIGFLLGVLAALAGRIMTGEGNAEQWQAARAEAEAAAAEREAALRKRHSSARRQGSLPNGE